MQAGMSQLGVTVEITGKPFATMMTDASTVEGTPNASFIVFNPAYPDGGACLKPRYHSDSKGSWEHTDWVDDPELDAAIEAAMMITTTRKSCRLTCRDQQRDRRPLSDHLGL